MKDIQRNLCARHNSKVPHDIVRLCENLSYRTAADDASLQLSTKLKPADKQH
jgi:hypothetical protein